MHRRYEEMTSAELVAETRLDRAIAVVPVAAIEQHGTHLPLGTDAILSDAMVNAAIARLPADRLVTFLPTLRIGASAEHEAFAGTLSHGWKVATARLIEIGTCLATAGFRRVVIVSAHGGNTASVDTAALELRRSHDLFVATASWLRFGYPTDLLPEEEIDLGIHGGAVETSLMLHFRPDLVRREAIGDHASLQSRLAGSARHLRAHGRLGFGWLAGDLNPAGVVGNATLATTEIGAAIAAHQAESFCAFLDDVLAFDLGQLAK